MAEMEFVKKYLFKIPDSCLGIGFVTMSPASDAIELTIQELTIQRDDIFFLLVRTGERCHLYPVINIGSRFPDFSLIPEQLAYLC
jgi:hypothetical protein